MADGTRVQGAIGANEMEHQVDDMSKGGQPARKWRRFQLLYARELIRLYVHQNLAGGDFGNSKIEVM
jgi:hypothetical protein